MSSKEPRIDLMKVTPRMAAEWLEAHDRLSTPDHKHNRHRSRRYVERIARDISGNHWELTHQAICFDWNGVLIDGQHRCAAIVNAKRAVETFVGFDFNPKCKLFVDGGRVRTMADIVALKYGAEANAKCCSVARAVMDPMLKCNSTRHEQVIFYEEHAEAIHLAYEWFHAMPVKAYRHSYVMAVVARASYTQDHDLLRRFTDLLREPIGMTAADISVERLKDDINAIVNNAKRGENQNRRWLYRRAEYLVDAFLKRNHKPSKSKVADQELFLIPGDAGYVAPAQLKLA